ncbi:MAG: hypothetical protein WC889_15190 [Myxococcota bacterium]
MKKKHTLFVAAAIIFATIMMVQGCESHSRYADPDASDGNSTDPTDGGYGVDGGDNPSCPNTCPEGYNQVEGGCAPASCGDCPEGMACIRGVCLPPEGPYYWSSCSEDSECPEGLVCAWKEYLDGVGFCVKVDGDCKDDGDCPGGGFCFNFFSSTSRCQRRCSLEVNDSCGDPKLRCVPVSSLVVGVACPVSSAALKTTPMCQPKCDVIMKMAETDPCTANGEGTCGEDGECSNPAAKGCSDGDRVCSDDGIFECREGGAMLSCLKACPQEQACREGACVDCTPNDHTGCIGKDVFWFDSCGRAGELKETCSDDKDCKEGGCVDCVPEDHLGCAGNDVYWYDSCGRTGSLKEQCGSGAECKSGKCVTTCKLTCSSDSYTYTCASGSSTKHYTYCTNGNRSSVTVEYSNGHTVTCTLNCSGSGGKCRDDTGQSCSLY